MLLKVRCKPVELTLWGTALQKMYVLLLRQCPVARETAVVSVAFQLRERSVRAFVCCFVSCAGSRIFKINTGISVNDITFQSEVIDSLELSMDHTGVS